MHQLNLNEKKESTVEDKLIIQEYLEAVIFSKFPNLNEGPKTKITNFITLRFDEIGQLQEFFTTF